MSMRTEMPTSRRHDLERADSWNARMLLALKATWPRHTFTPATDWDDMKEATDWVGIDPTGQEAPILLASRTNGMPDARTFGIRYSRPSGARTEWDKILSGQVTHYYTGYVPRGTMVGWTILDLDVFREKHGLFRYDYRDLGDSVFANTDLQPLYEERVVYAADHPLGRVEPVQTHHPLTLPDLVGRHLQAYGAITQQTWREFRYFKPHGKAFGKSLSAVVLILKQRGWDIHTGEDGIRGYRLHAAPGEPTRFPGLFE